MPAPAVYVLAVVGTVAASVAFYQFVYEPHIAPKLEQWAENFIQKRRARRRQREMVAVPASHGRSGLFVDDDASSTLSSSSGESSNGTDGFKANVGDKPRSVYEMDILGWRTGASSGLRNRRGGSNIPPEMDEPVSSTFKYPLMHPTHIISSSISSVVTTPASELPNPTDKVVMDSANLPTPNPFAGPFEPMTPQPTSEFRFPPPAPTEGVAERHSSVSVMSLSAPSSNRSQTTLSLSQSHPIDLLDAEHDIEVVHYTPSPSVSSGSLIGVGGEEAAGLDNRFSLSDDDTLSSTSSRAESRMSALDGSDHEVFYSMHEASATSDISSFLPPRGASTSSNLSSHLSESGHGRPGSRRESVISLSSTHSFTGSEVFSEGSWDHVGNADGTSR